MAHGDAVRRVLAAIKGRREGETGWKLPCPAHEDQKPSCSLSQGEKGAMLHCFAGCSQEDVLAGLERVGIKPEMLFDDWQDNRSCAPAVSPSDGERRPASSCSTSDDKSKREFPPRKPVTAEEKPWAPCPEPPADLSHPQHGRPDVAHAIHDGAGRLFGLHCRWKTATDKHVSWWRGGWSLHGVKVAHAPLYRSEHLERFDPAAPLFVTEGEPAADALSKIGAQVLATVCGASSLPSPSALAELDKWTGRIVLWADSDDLGRKHMARLGEALRARGHVAVVYEDPSLPPGGDAVEWLEAKDSRDSADLLAELVRIAEELAMEPDQPAPTATLLQIVSLREFAAATEDVAPPLIGSAAECLLPEGGLFFMYGDGGSGKTTLSVDAVAHFASGTRWLDFPVPRPARVLLIENEGPRGEFRKKLARKIADWQGEPFEHNVMVLQEPWAGFTLADPDLRRELGATIARERIDLVMVGPLVTIGAKGAGTPDDVNEFAALLGALCAEAAKPVALWVIHHENKAGEISGAWTRLPDTLLQVQAQGNGRTHLHWRKARWCSEVHGLEMNLAWAEGAGFNLERPEKRDYRTEVLGAIQPGEWVTQSAVVKRVRGQKKQVTEELDAMTAAGILLCTQGGKGRPANARLYALPGTPHEQTEIPQ